ncbi:hypothetical protein EIN_183870 [Entamoeba invadens IP1]|uniref:hypothetical protein n=1 Tax=Entamoeba invadens IP1 TaxID=370355 RepID=UPI0002C3EBAC|nr:hypothetical protein EIN_183870 [Entamoeba invadens IP1]ELP94070.1 hypothetical protein EIN_183870 [Entamoeba invadens IP1]|eukprot:XP_004260841.1 hypothetical protein EIN_183870 [Entamoeba invadens IP1]
MAESIVLSLYILAGISASLIVSFTMKSIGVFTPYLSRKLVHISVGVSVMIFFKYFEGSDLITRFWCVLPLLLFCVVFYVFGSGHVSGKLVDFMTTSVCRTGKATEMTKGPLFYCVVMVFLIIVFWKSYPPSVIGLMVMVTGDGIAEIFGKIIPSKVLKTPWNETKTVAGVIAVCLGGTLGSIVICYHVFGQFYVLQSFISALLGAAVEFYSPPGLDNIFIPIPALLINLPFFYYCFCCYLFLPNNKKY